MSDIYQVRKEMGEYYLNVAQNEDLKKEFDLIKKINAELFDAIPFPVIFTDVDPYENAEQMRERVKSEKVIYIYTEYSGHPYLTKEENSVGRAVHDVYAHLVCGCPFSFQGEYNAYLEQRKHYPEEVWSVLFAEIPMQTSAFFYNKSFDYDQKTFQAPECFMKVMEQFKKDYSNNAIFEYKNKKLKMKEGYLHEIKN